MNVRRGYGLVGLLVTLVCILVLAVIGLNALNTGVTGQGSVKENTVRSLKDKMALASLHQSLTVDAMGNRDMYIVPSELTQRRDRADDTTANLFSALLARNLASPEMLISGNEYNAWVLADDDYKYHMYHPGQGQYWDPNFVADLDEESNVSYAHLPLYGDRFDKQWRATLDSSFPVMGNRGPRDGIPDPYSWSYGRDGTWAAHVVYGDGHVDFVTTFAPGSLLVQRDGMNHPDNFYAMEEGPEGSDAVLSFTQQMTPQGPKLQYD